MMDDEDFLIETLDNETLQGTITKLTNIENVMFALSDKNKSIKKKYNYTVLYWNNCI